MKSFKWLVGSSVDSKVYNLDGSSARLSIGRYIIQMARRLVGSSVDFYVSPTSEVSGPTRVIVIMPKGYTALVTPKPGVTYIYIYICLILKYMPF